MSELDLEGLAEPRGSTEGSVERKPRTRPGRGVGPRAVGAPASQHVVCSGAPGGLRTSQALTQHLRAHGPRNADSYAEAGLGELARSTGPGQAKGSSSPAGAGVRGDPVRFP